MFNMECDQNTELILQLLEEDLKDLEGQQKGKQAAGNPTDLELTIAITKDEILAWPPYRIKFWLSAPALQSPQTKMS